MFGTYLGPENLRADWVGGHRNLRVEWAMDGGGRGPGGLLAVIENLRALVNGVLDFGVENLGARGLEA